jgi:hypothetical protein
LWLGFTIVSTPPPEKMCINSPLIGLAFLRDFRVSEARKTIPAVYNPPRIGCRAMTAIQHSLHRHGAEIR